MSLLRYLLKPILAGLVLAAIIVVIHPNLRSYLPELNQSISRVDRNSFSYAVGRAAPAVVNVYSHRQGPNNFSQLLPQGLGSGIIMRADGYILTNYHVVRQADQIFIALQDGRVADASLIGSDPYTDLAVLKISLSDLPVISLDLERETRIGDMVLAIGNPYNLGQTITQGIISATGRTGLSSNFQDFIQTDAAINQGNSGGALVNADGNLIGVNTANYQQLGEAGVGLNFAIPIELAHTIMGKLIRDGRVIRGHLGLTGTPVNQTIARQLRLLEPMGMAVTEVDPTGPAAKAGLRAHDVLISVNGEPIRGIDMLMDVIAETPPGTEVNIILIRQGERYNVPVTIEERPPIQ
ncbi:outer membrane-stress sensor serine endopeptidase DegS [Ferrimonas lipolytica]|uniref:Outer membrane-stress sensor serine endopeptidase DegS n=1 Tax=Ferrimonas lipolytica TaxID=2724191 RepID=A0A6H1UGX1_9GAMM|nr:outer membrane-stress sensor serine endopeptidase DegS [Ferrimonas lipolytica]QIZ77879.1 outer membrane-stress sensor serine endopeptidase DegS [Ferrimonas lipolytica]